MLSAVRSWIVSAPDRLDSFLSGEGRMPSRSKAQAAISDGLVTVNDIVVRKPAHRLQEGDRVDLSQPDEPSTPSHITPLPVPLPILYEDSSCMVVFKSAGIAVHPGAGMDPGEMTVLHGAAHLLQERGLPFSPGAVLVHRLDKETTGCLLLAKTPEAHRELQKQFESRTVRKQYLALVAGIPPLDRATVDAPIGRSVRDRTTMAVSASLGSREAQTTYVVIARGPHAALLRCDLHTGRTHQIRVHLQSIGHAILGDDTYATPLSERLRDEFEIHTLCLHAERLTFNKF
jgi:23S rRNA pseudouridine1911/1915/1917 synthase